MDPQNKKKDFVKFCEKSGVLILCRYLLGMYSIKMKMFVQNQSRKDHPMRREVSHT